MKSWSLLHVIVYCIYHQLKENKFHGDPVAPPKHHGSHGPGMLLKKLLDPLKLIEFVEAVLEFLLKTP